MPVKEVFGDELELPEDEKRGDNSLLLLLELERECGVDEVVCFFDDFGDFPTLGLPSFE